MAILFELIVSDIRTIGNPPFFGLENGCQRCIAHRMVAFLLPFMKTKFAGVARTVGLRMAHAR